MLGRARPQLWPLALLALAWPATPARAQEVLVPEAREHVPGELLVRFEPGVDGRARAAVRGAEGARLLRSLRLPGLQLVSVRGSVTEAAERLAKRPEVDFAEPNFVYRISAVPNDPKLGQLWGLNNTGQSVEGLGGTPDADIDAPEAWDRVTGSSSVLVAVVDSGVAADHPDLAPNIAPGGFDFFANDGDPRDLNGHGTHVAGTIAARGNNGAGMTGVSWESRILPLRICGANGDCEGDVVADAFDYAGDMGAKVVNASFGGPNSAAISSAIDSHPGTLFVAAAGNSSDDVDATPRFPCAYPQANVLCVAATDQADDLSDFSNFGDTHVDLGAPGSNVVSAMAFQDLFRTGFEFSNFSTAWAVAGSAPTWSRTNEAAGSGSWSGTDSAGGNYAATGAKTMTTAGTMNLAGRQDCYADYDLELDMNADLGDALVVRGLNGGSFSPIVALTGNSGGFDMRAEPLGAQFLDESAFQLRFSLEPDGDGTVDDGAHVDTVAVRCKELYDGESYVSFDGTSMAAPHVSGIAALLFSAKPDAGVAQVRAALLDGVEPKPSLAGKTVTGGRANARSSLDLLVPPAPPPPPAPDAAAAATPAPAPAGSEAQQAELAVSARIGRQRLLAALRRGLLVTLRSTRVGTATIDLWVDSRTGRRFRLARSVRVGRKRARVRAGRTRVRVRFTRRARVRLRRARRVRLQVRTAITSGGERDRDRRRTVTLTR